MQATLKHFAAYTASRAGRNMAPVSMGPRELADVILVPFEMAIRLGGARSVMPTYVDIDGVPASADPRLLTTLLRDEYGFDGVVVSDYYAVSFLELQHAVAGSPGQAAVLALTAGTRRRAAGYPLLRRAAARPGGERRGAAARSSTGRWPGCCGRSSSSACSIPAGPRSPGQADERAAQAPDLDPPAQRDIARRLAEESVILLKNDARRGPEAGGRCPLAADAKVAVIGPLADDPLAFFGCYSMPRHLGHAEGFDGPAARPASRWPPCSPRCGPRAWR